MKLTVTVLSAVLFLSGCVSMGTYKKVATDCKGERVYYSNGKKVENLRVAKDTTCTDSSTKLHAYK